MFFQTPQSGKLYHVGSLTYTTRTLAIMFFWLFWGDFCFVLMEGVVPSLIPLKFKALSAPNSIIGLVMVTIPNAINCVCNPIISFKSDRYRSRWGRRIPFIIFTLPFLVTCLVMMAFSTQIAFYLRHHLGGLLGGFAPDTVAIAILGLVVLLFSFCNTFVNSVFWYLFNDIVPEHMLARYMSWFRLVSMGSSALYSLFIFKHAATHSSEILVGAALLYLFGFGAMCFKIREGEYPPPPEYVDGQVGPISALKTYARECMGLSHYWWLFLVNMAMAIGFSASMFMIFFQQSVGLSMEMIGKLLFAGSITGAIAAPISGWLADRFHPIRIVMLGIALQLITGPISLMWLFWHPKPNIVFYTMLTMSIFLYSPIYSLVACLDPPLHMRVFPRSRYGQFCSANAMLRSIALMAGGLMVGVYLDVLTKNWGPDIAYRLLPLWNIVDRGVVLFCLIKFYRSWQSYGGDAGYQAPLPTSTEKPGVSEVGHGTTESVTAESLS